MKTKRTFSLEKIVQKNRKVKQTEEAEKRGNKNRNRRKRTKQNKTKPNQDAENNTQDMDGLRGMSIGAHIRTYGKVQPEPGCSAALMFPAVQVLWLTAAMVPFLIHVVLVVCDENKVKSSKSRRSGQGQGHEEDSAPLLPRHRTWLEAQAATDEIDRYVVFGTHMVADRSGDPFPFSTVWCMCVICVACMCVPYVSF